MEKKIEILNNDYQIFRVKVQLAKGDKEGDLILSCEKSLWQKFGWDEGTVLEIRQDDKDVQELTIRLATRGLREQLGIKK